jgi:NADPH-dependent curcumin reductase CurA
MGNPNTAREVRLASRPIGWPTEQNFDLVEVAIPEASDGRLLVRNLLMSVDPYMRNRMNGVRTYMPPFQVGRALEGGAVGEVVAGEADGIQPGDLVAHGYGWRDYAAVDANRVTKVDPRLGSPGAYLGALGMPGLTAYAGLVDVAPVAEGDVVFVSGAAGAVGGLAGQIARLRGASRVIGSAGTAEKVRYLVEELNFDAAFNYRDDHIDKQLRAAAPDGIDVYFDNVGGTHLEAAIALLNNHGRIAACGMISLYNRTELAPGLRNMQQILGKRLNLRGYVVDDYAHLRQECVTQMSCWIRDGSVKYRETVMNGLANAPSAFLGLMRGDNIGKMLVRIA